MNKYTNLSFILLISSLCIGCTSCSNNASHANKTTADTLAKTIWENPRKGKIWEKENVVHIPLTAYENHLLGPVKSVTYREYELPGNGDSAKVLVDSGYNEYNQSGHLIVQNEYDANKIPKIICSYKYDGKNNPTEWDLRLFDDNVNSKTTFTYDDKGNRLEEVTIDSNKENSSKTIYKNDNRGNEIEADIYNNLSNIKQIITYKYDKRGFQVEYVEKSGPRIVNLKLQCSYDDKGNKTGGTDYSSDTTIADKWTEKNDAMGRRIETDYFLPDDSLLEKRTIKYDEMGYPVEYNTYKPDGNLYEDKSYSYKNEYDKAGNIIRQTEIRWNGGKRVPITYTEYEIVYY